MAREAKEREERLTQAALEAKQRRLAQEREAAALKEQQQLLQIKQRLQQQTAGSGSGLWSDSAANLSDKSDGSRIGSGFTSTNSLLGQLMMRRKPTVAAATSGKSSLFGGSGKSFAAITAISSTATVQSPMFTPSKVAGEEVQRIEDGAGGGNGNNGNTDGGGGGDNGVVGDGDYYIAAEQWDDDDDGVNDGDADKKKKMVGMGGGVNCHSPSHRPDVVATTASTTPTATAAVTGPATSNDASVVLVVRAAAVADTTNKAHGQGQGQRTRIRPASAPLSGQALVPGQEPAVGLSMSPRHHHHRQQSSDSAARTVAAHLASRESRAAAVRPTAPLPSRHLGAHGQGLVQGRGQGLGNLFSTITAPTALTPTAVDATVHTAPGPAPGPAIAIANATATSLPTTTPGPYRDGDSEGTGPTKVTSAVYLSSLRVLIGSTANTSFQYKLHLYTLSTHPINNPYSPIPSTHPRNTLYQRIPSPQPLCSQVRAAICVCGSGM